jgi:hypothetical protein
MPRPTKREIELLDIVDVLQRQLAELRAAVSPGRIANHRYYVEAAERFRESAKEVESVITPDWTPVRPPIKQLSKAKKEAARSPEPPLSAYRPT